MKVRSFRRPATGRGRSASATAFIASILLATPALAQNVAITGGTVVIGDGSAPISNGTVIVQNGRVTAAGAGIAVPTGAQRVDATGKWVAPGLVAGFTRLGIIEVDLGVDAAEDARAPQSPWSAALDIVPAINPRAGPIQTNRAAGITRAVVAPATTSNIFAGQGAVIDLGSDMDAVTRPRAFQFAEFGETGAEEAGGSRAATFLTFRESLRNAQRYAANPAAYDSGSRDSLLKAADAAALVPVVTGQTPLLVHVERGSDILNVIGLEREFPQLKLVLVGAVEGWTVAPQIAASGIPVIASALVDLPGSFETLAATQSNIGRMRAAGVKVSIGMINDDEARQARYSPQYAGNLVALAKIPGASGLSWGEAFATISSGPAEALGMGGEIGSLRAGRRGDVVIWSGDPLENASHAERVWIDGVEQPLVTRQTKLRDRYRTLDETQRPRQYER